jgi:hypothetical protein
MKNWMLRGEIDRWMRDFMTPPFRSDDTNGGWSASSDEGAGYGWTLESTDDGSGDGRSDGEYELEQG